MKSVLLSAPSKRCENIASGKETIEVRKTRPSIPTPFKVYIYCTKGKPFIQKIRFGDIAISHTQISKNLYNGKVIGEFVCDRVDRIDKRGINNNFDYCYLSLNEWGNDDIEIEIKDIKESCVPKNELNAYGANSSCLYAWHISDLKIYDKPKELSEFFARCRIPESKCKCCNYCSELEDRHGRFYNIKRVTRPPQDWMYIEE